MKTKSLIAACLAGIGIYLIVIGALTVMFSVSMLISAGRGSPMLWLQYLGFCMPFLTGIIFLVFSSSLASVICRCAKTEEQFTGIIQPEVAVLVACVVTGLTLLLTQFPEFARLGVQQFLVAASPAYAANHRHEDYRVMLVSPGVCSLVAVFIIWKAKAISSWVTKKYAADT